MINKANVFWDMYFGSLLSYRIKVTNVTSFIITFFHIHFTFQCFFKRIHEYFLVTSGTNFIKKYKFSHDSSVCAPSNCLEIFEITNLTCCSHSLLHVCLDRIQFLHVWFLLRWIFEKFSLLVYKSQCLQVQDLTQPFST